jgi:hypothetical protein
MFLAILINNTVIYNKALGRINLCKNYLTPKEFVALCKLVASRFSNKIVYSKKAQGLCRLVASRMSQR